MNLLDQLDVVCDQLVGSNANQGPYVELLSKYIEGENH